MTELKADTVAAAVDRPVVRTSLGRIIERIGTHNFSLLIALAALIAIFGSLRPDVFFLLRNILNIGQAIAILGIWRPRRPSSLFLGGSIFRSAPSSACLRFVSPLQSDGPAPPF